MTHDLARVILRATSKGWHRLACRLRGTSAVHSSEDDRHGGADRVQSHAGDDRHARAGELWDRPLAELTHADLLDALHRGWCTAFVVPRVLDILAADPLASAGRFRGDLLRGLMDVRGAFWTRHPRLYARYRDTVRAGAAARRHLRREERLDFWLAPSHDRAHETRQLGEVP